MTVSGQPSVVYSYDNANRLTQISQGSSVVSFTYDAAGRRQTLTLPNGVLVDYDYDNTSRVTGITYKKDANVLGNLTYEYDKAGTRTKIGGSFARTGHPGAVTSTAYNAANQQTAFGERTLAYDNNGNLTSISNASGTTLYTWNARNQLTGISGPGVTASFVYDGLGRREKKTINGSLTEFLFDGVNPVQETSGATVLANILGGLGIDEIFSRTDVPAAVTRHFPPDALGSTIGLTDSAGAVQTEYTFEPFGKTTATGLSSSNPYHYTGRENDGTGLYYYRARYYHPHLQRFIGEDPFPGIRTLSQSLNRYAYVLNKPDTLVDHDGQFPDPATGIGGALVGGIAGGLTAYLSGGSPSAIVYSAAIGAVIGGLTTPWMGAAAANLIGTPLGEVLDPSSLGRGEIPMYRNPPPEPPRPIPPDPFAGQKIGCPPEGCKSKSAQ